MVSPIKVYKTALKEFNVTEGVNAPTVARLSYIQTQLTEQKAILNRLLFDYVMATVREGDAKDDISKEAHAQNVGKYRGDIRQMISNIQINTQLIDELREEYPELKVGE